MWNKTNLNKVEKWADNWVEYLVFRFSNSGDVQKKMCRQQQPRTKTRNMSRLAGWLHAYAFMHYALCIMHHESALNFWAYNIFQEKRYRCFVCSTSTKVWVDGMEFYPFAFFFLLRVKLKYALLALHGQWMFYIACYYQIMDFFPTLFGVKKTSGKSRCLLP